MSTRSAIKLVGDFKEALYFYRHSDGYPEGAVPPLQEFLKLIQDGRIRDNVSQGGGWLILFGAKEYGATSCEYTNNWKVGAIEPNTKNNYHNQGDLEFRYVVDMNELTIICEDIYDDTRKKLVDLKNNLEYKA